MEINQLKRNFINIFGGCEENIRIFTSPGRVNLIGEHTDYNGGFVFPAAITMGTTIAVRPRTDRILNLAATDIDSIVTANLDNLNEYKELAWGNYQLGVADELQKHEFQLIGCDMLYDDTIPHGCGLSSSAAIEVSTAITLATLGNESHGNNQPIDMVTMAKIGQKAENNYVGVNCGIMDQFASALGKKNHAIFLNCKTLDFKYIPFNLKGYKIIISNTNKKRSLAHSKYNERRAECCKGLDILKSALPDATCLGDISYQQFVSIKDLIKDEVIQKRVEHVISEDDRVLKSIEALTQNKLHEFGKLMTESHNSLREAYEVTGIELDTLVEEALKVDGVLGSRMTGAGFGGCTVSLVKEDAVENFISQVGKNYFDRIGLKADFYVTEIGHGGREKS